ncbi:hypothetical protein ACFX2I_031423 [Malus domestica]
MSVLRLSVIFLSGKWKNMTVSSTGPCESSRRKARTNPDVVVASVSVPQTSSAASVRSLVGPTANLRGRMKYFLFF